MDTATESTSSASSTEIQNTTYSIQDLQRNKKLWYKIHVFVYDLRNFDEVATSQDRLNSILTASYVDGLYIGLPYFTPEEAATIRATIIQGSKSLQTVIRETLQERLERRMKKSVQSGDYRVCAAHDLAPIFEKAFCIDQKMLARDTKFLALMTAWRLHLPEDQEWDGLGKRKVVVRSALERKKKGRR